MCVLANQGPALQDESTPQSGNISGNGVSPEAPRGAVPRNILDNMSGVTIAMLPRVERSPEGVNITDADTSRSTSKESRKWSSEAALEELISNGYDSDGENAPLSVLPEFEEEYQEHPLPSSESLEGLEEVEPQAVPIDCHEEVRIISTEDIMKLKVNELRSELKKRGLQIKGLKTELQRNLIQAMKDRVPIQKEVLEEVCF